MSMATVKAGAVNDEVELLLAGGQRLVAIVTRQSTETLGLRTQMQAIALIKSSPVLIATVLEGGLDIAATAQRRPDGPGAGRARFTAAPRARRPTSGPDAAVPSSRSRAR
jgi:molybdopterin-binding protein